MEEFKEKLARIDVTRARLAQVQADRNAAERLHRLVTASLDQKVVEIQFNCSHEVTKYHGDPAGGSDSFTVCEICGANL